MGKYERVFDKDGLPLMRVVLQRDGKEKEFWLSDSDDMRVQDRISAAIRQIETSPGFAADMAWIEAVQEDFWSTQPDYE